MSVLPVSAFYLVLHVLDQHTAISNSDNYAAAAAIIVTNIIIGVYCYKALTEEDDEEEDDKRISDNDVHQPRVGIYKQRVD